MNSPGKCSTARPKPNGSDSEAHEVRQLVAARDDLRPLYLNSQGFRVGKSGEVIQVKDGDALKQEIRLGEVSQINLFGNVQLSTQAVQSFCAAEVPICYFSQGGWFYGITNGLNAKNVFLRHRQFVSAGHEGTALRLSRALVAGKVRNQRTLLQRNHIEPPAVALRQMKMLAEKAESASDIESLLGIEGSAARVYFSEFAGMLKADDSDSAHNGSAAEFSFDFTLRNRRPPRDPVNALLSLAYSILVKDLTITCYALGFDPYWGFYHQPRFGRPALALDLMEPFRALIADSVVLTAINTGMVTSADFIRSGPSVALKPNGRKGFFRAYELRMDTLVTHPMFDYRVSYHQRLENIAAIAKGKEKKEAEKQLRQLQKEDVPASTRPTLTRWASYTQVASLEDQPETLPGPFNPDLIVFTEEKQTDDEKKPMLHRLGLEATLQLTSALRNAAMKAAGENPPEWLTGHQADGKPSLKPHVAFFPLPYVGADYADGHVMGLAMALPREIETPGETKEAALRRVLGPLLFRDNGEDKTIRLWRNKSREKGPETVWEWNLKRETRDYPELNLRARTWTRPSAEWASVTPVVLHHYPKRGREGEVERIMLEAFESAGLPQPVELRVQPVSIFKGAGHVKSMPEFTEGGERLCRYQVHIRARFPSKVEGPLLVGRGRFRGYGLLRPVSPFAEVRHG